MWQPHSPNNKQAPAARKPSDASAASTRQKHPGRQFAQVIRLKPECVEEYKACHAKIWPEVSKQIRDCGLEDYSIYYDDKTSLLFGTYRYIGYDYAGDMERMAANPKVREWWKMTDRMQESLVDGAVSSETGEPSWWRPMEQVFYHP